MGFVITQQPSSGQLSGTVPNLTYTPNANFVGSDSFVFVVNDGQLNSAPSTVPITVSAVNDTPVAHALALTLTEDQAGAVTLSGHDPDGDTLGYTVASQPQNGVLSGTVPNLTYTPNANFNGSDSFSYTVNDGALTSSSATVSLTVTAVNDPPVAVDDAISQAGTAALAIPVLSNDSDVDNDNLSIVGATASVGSVSFTPQSLTYTPVQNFTGNALVQYTIADGNGGTASAQAVVTITADNGGTAPVVTVNVPADVEVQAQGLLTKVDLGVATATDGQGNAIAVELLDSQSHFKPGCIPCSGRPLTMKATARLSVRSSKSIRKSLWGRRRPHKKDSRLN